LEHIQKKNSKVLKQRNLFTSVSPSLSLDLSPPFFMQVLLISRKKTLVPKTHFRKCYLRLCDRLILKC
jgi:hypothetical protein